MRSRALILIALWSILLTEPAFSNYAIEGNASCQDEQVKELSCSSPCGESEEEEESDCERNRCNPLMSCPTGNFYLFGNVQPILPEFISMKENIVAKNDNRLLEQLSECWHPPEII